VTRALAVLLVALLALAGCSRTKEDLLRKAETVKTRSELESALGRPDDIAKLGPVEQWTYKASNGQVVFVILGDTVTIQAAGPAEPKR
jgi:hypothetical protein